MAAAMKSFTFWLDEEAIKYKFPVDASMNLIDSTIRDAFQLSSDVEYYLVDMQDDARVNMSSLFYLDNDSKIRIQMKHLNRSSTNNYASSVHTSTSSVHEAINMTNNSGLLSFSDNNEKLLLDLSSTSSNSESGSKSAIHYSSTVTETGTTKLNKAQARRKNREKKILCNKKIIYFIEKYGKTNSMGSVHILQEMKNKLDIELHDLYNFLKYVRHNTVISSLGLNRDNMVEILSNIYKNTYLNSC